jgi:hypothetical protein
MMKSLLLAIGFTIMNLNEGMGSALMDAEQNDEIKKEVFRKAKHPNFNIKSLSTPEKEWIYETELLTAYQSLKKEGLIGTEETSKILADLARYYEYKEQPNLAKQAHLLRAQQDLESALRGDEALLGIFHYLINQQLLKGDFFKDIINKYSKDPDDFARGMYKYLIKDKSFTDSVPLLAEAYQASSLNTLETRKKTGEMPIPLYPASLALCLENLIKANN